MSVMSNMWRRIRAEATEDAGFSLTELMVVAGLMVFVLGTTYTAFNAVGVMSDRIQAREQAASMSTIAVERIAREIRQARQLGDGSYAFKTTNPERAVFYVDLNHTGSPVRITYYVTGNALYRTQAVSAKAAPTDADYGAESTPKLIVPLASGFTSVFTYYDNGDFTSGSGNMSTFTSPTVVTAPASTTMVSITVRSSVKIGASTMTGTTSTLVNVRSTDTILNAQ